MVIVPLTPGGVMHNRRSSVGLDNFVDLILVCADHSKAVNQTFLISDGEDLSTTEQLRNIGSALGLSAH
jgi:nucleoside-diphosphate-sugar epimerase